jgi:hypothetical protein
MIRIYFFYANTGGILGLGGLVVILADYWRCLIRSIRNCIYCSRWNEKQHGLTIITDENEITVFPNIVSDDPLTIGLDYLICATKIWYRESLRSLEKCITKTLSFFLYITCRCARKDKYSFLIMKFWRVVYIISMIESPGKKEKWGLLKNYTLDQIQHRFGS